MNKILRFLFLFSFYQQLCCGEIPQHVSAIYDGDSSSWTKKLKKVEDRDLIKSVEIMLEEGEKDNTELWAFANRALSELYGRAYGKAHQKDLESLRNKIVKKTNTCLLDRNYNIEAAGIQKRSISSHSKGRSVFHPYPDKEKRKTIKKWLGSKKKLSFEEHFKKYAKYEEKKKLKSKSVVYLKPEQRKNYRVTFKDRSVRIGKKVPKDGLYLYSLSADGKELLAGKGKRGTFHHTSFFAGDPVQCAGKMRIKKGKIVSINLISGHYKPQKCHGESLRRFLSDEARLGESLAKKLEIKEYR